MCEYVGHLKVSPSWSSRSSSEQLKLQLKFFVTNSFCLIDANVSKENCHLCG